MDGENDALILDQLESQLSQEKNKNTQLMGAISQSSFNNQNQENLIQFQLQSNDILESIEHFLKGDTIKSDEEGNTYYAVQENEDLVILNDYGVNSVMQILGNYINKNTNLSWYDEERINEILGDFGDELADFVYCNYEKMGLTTEFKKSRYKLLVLNILHIIESAYRRAIGGKEREGLSTTRFVTQSDNVGMVQRQNSQQIQKKFNLMKPNTW